MKLHFFSKIDGDLIQYITDASWKDNVLSFYETLDGKTYLVNITIKNDRLELLKDGEATTKMEFIPQKHTRASYQTSFGSLAFEIFTKILKITKEKIIIEYETIFDTKKASDVKIWLIIKENA